MIVSMVSSWGVRGNVPGMETLLVKYGLDLRRPACVATATAFETTLVWTLLGPKLMKCPDPD